MQAAEKLVQDIMVDLLGNPKQSAVAGFPLYTVSGETGFIWIASFNPENPCNDLAILRHKSCVVAGDARADARATGRGVGPRTGTEEIAMEESGGVYVVPAYFNRAIKLDAVIDSGASDVSVPADVVLILVRAENDL